MQETKVSDIKILARIICFVSMLGYCEWKELNDCILSLANSSHAIMALHIFLELPAFYGRFINRSIVERMLVPSKKLLSNPREDREEDWNLGLQITFKIGILITDPEIRLEVTSDIKRTVQELKNKEMIGFLDEGMENLADFLIGDGNVVNYNKDQRDFVAESAYGFTCGYRSEENGNMVWDKILRMVEKPEQSKQDLQARFDRGWFEHLNRYSSLEILRIFMSNELQERSRDMAIRKLNLLLSYHTSKKIVIEVSVMRQLQPLLISCLTRQDIPGNMFKVLGEVVYHVANDMLINHGDRWFELWSYIGTECKTEFERAVYIFQCLTTKVADKEFVIPAIDNLLPKIRNKLRPPREVLVDNSAWVFTFTGAFCAAIHLTELKHHETVEEIRKQMIYTVTKLVERGMEGGLVSRAFGDMERIVEKQAKWYTVDDYRFVKLLLKKLSEIRNIKSHSTLRRTLATLNREVPD